MQRVRDRIEETGTATSTAVGSLITLTGAVAGRGSFSSRWQLGEYIYVCCVDGNTWGTYRVHLTDSTHLMIDKQFETSSVSGSPPDITFNAVTFSGSSMTVFNNLPAERVEELFTKGQSAALAVGLAMP